MALEDYRADMERCSRCSYCKWIPLAHIRSQRFAKGCPSVEYNKFHCYSAGGRLAVSLSLLEGRISYDDSFLKIAFSCLMDGNCDVTCKICRFNMEPLEAMRELRFKLVEDGHPLPQHKLYIDNLRKERNMMMKPKSERGWWAKGLDIKNIAKEKAEVVFHAGCRYSYGESNNTAKAAVTLLSKAGIDIGLLGEDEHCCGGRAYDMGYREDFNNLAESNIKAWKQAGVKTIVTSCADCYHAFKRLYPQAGSDFEVLHTVEFVNRLIREGKLKFSKTISKKVTYHDPCHLGRLGEPYIAWDGTEKKIRGQIVTHEPKKPRYNGANGIYEPPREVLTSIPGIKLVEMERIKEYAWCCGAGGGVAEAYPSFSSWVARERIEEAKATGADILVTACPGCERNLAEAINATGAKMQVSDIIELVSQAI